MRASFSSFVRRTMRMTFEPRAAGGGIRPRGESTRSIGNVERSMKNEPLRYRFVMRVTLGSSCPLPEMYDVRNVRIMSMPKHKSTMTSMKNMADGNRIVMSKLIRNGTVVTEYKMNTPMSRSHLSFHGAFGLMMYLGKPVTTTSVRCASSSGSLRSPSFSDTARSNMTCRSSSTWTNECRLCILVRWRCASSPSFKITLFVCFSRSTSCCRLGRRAC